METEELKQVHDRMVNAMERTERAKLNKTTMSLFIKTVKGVSLLLLTVVLGFVSVSALAAGCNALAHPELSKIEALSFIVGGAIATAISMTGFCIFFFGSQDTMDKLLTNLKGRTE